MKQAPSQSILAHISCKMDLMEIKRSVNFGSQLLFHSTVNNFRLTWLIKPPFKGHHKVTGYVCSSI